MATMHSDDWAGLPRKRSWEEEAGSAGFGEHRNKRLQSLPLRTSSSQKRWSDPPCFPCTITPSDSENDEKTTVMAVDGDADMMVEDSYTEIDPFQNGNGASNVSGRMPTPINASFAAQVRGNNWQPQRDSSMSVPHAFPMPADEDPSVPRTLAPSPEWSMVQNRRLPSPISESGGEDMMPRSPGMVLDSSNDQRPHLPHMPHSTNPNAVGLLHPNIQTNSQLLPQCPEFDDAGMMDREGSPSSAPASPSPGRKLGHCRSKHTLNSWTSNQPGMKKAFSIGYRADCEKCRMKIPGHFNHIIVS